jgi:hypothetical protein
MALRAFGGKLYWLIKHYFAIYLAIGGREDGLKQAPLDDTFYTSSIKVLDEHPRRRGCWAIFPIDIYIYMSSHNINIPILPFTMPQGMREWMDGHG